jgi:hypothetical protein
MDMMYEYVSEKLKVVAVYITKAYKGNRVRAPLILKTGSEFHQNDK